MTLGLNETAVPALLRAIRSVTLNRHYTHRAAELASFRRGAAEQFAIGRSAVQVRSSDPSEPRLGFHSSGCRFVSGNKIHALRPAAATARGRRVSCSAGENALPRISRLEISAVSPDDEKIMEMVTN